MALDVSPAAFEEKVLIRRMMELYNYDFSEFDGADLDAHGTYGYDYLDHYWVEAGRHPFIVRVDGKLAGFVLVSRHTLVVPDGHAISEFFILRKYRRRGIGQQVAFGVFDRFPGPWEVREIAANVPAQRFWRRVIDRYTAGAFTETRLASEAWDGPVQTFVAPAPPG